jgi:hypothetical protein
MKSRIILDRNGYANRILAGLSKKQIKGRRLDVREERLSKEIRLGPPSTFKEEWR